MKIWFLLISAFCFLHIIRDYFQIKQGYNKWYTRIGHFWHAPKYEIHGMVVFVVLGMIFLYLGLD